jgi:hypothetical protein
MSRPVAFAYAGARMQARYGRLVTRSEWERLRRLGSLNAFLQAARETGLRPWVLQVDSTADAHQLEAQLRLLFRRRVRELAGWAPASWRPAIEWSAVLPDLPAIAHGVRGGASWPWIAGDTQLAWLAIGDRPRAPQPLQGFLPAKGVTPDPLAHWLARWRERWPAVLPTERAGLDELVQLIRAALAAASANATAAEAALQRPLRRLFRRQTRAPAGLFAYLVLTWLEMVAVRGALLRRRLGLPLEGVAA